MNLFTQSLIAFCIALLGVMTTAHAENARSGIEAANTEFSAAFAKGDASALASLYAAEGQVLPANSPPIRGREAVHKFWQGAMDSGIATVTLKTVEVYGHGATATEVGEYELHDKGGKVLDQGKYIVIWRHSNGKWLLLRDMFSTNSSKPA
jgi:uncharacterized protein (TIGR02246 family)